jgi:hypothetical protein
MAVLLLIVSQVERFGDMENTDLLNTGSEYCLHIRLQMDSLVRLAWLFYSSLDI